MCGITGIMAFNEVGRMHMIQLVNATQQLEKRGPDHQGTFLHDLVGLGHRRLAIQDTSYNGNQPMKDESERYTIVFNGEIYNYRELRADLIKKGHQFHSGTDTEVLLRLYIIHGEKCLDLLDGFFAFAIHDKADDSLFIARDRIGIKPLYYAVDDDKFVFGSEMKSIFAFNIQKSIDFTSVYQYLQLNYIPSPHSALKEVKKLEPGHYLKVKKKDVQKKVYYTIPYSAGKYAVTNYEEAQEQLRELLESSITNRLVADVPLGCFLSGGVDSSIIAALASKKAQNLETYSIGYADNPYFDETNFAKAVAKKHGTNHTVFKLTNKEIFSHVYDVLDYLDEPFADSSALPVYILSKETAKTMKVALSGDGADEIFAGYNKYFGDYRLRNPRMPEKVIGSLGTLWSNLPKSRNDKFSNYVRIFEKMSDGMKMTSKERYWRWCSFTSEAEALNLFNPDRVPEIVMSEFEDRKGEVLQFIRPNGDVNDWLRSDVDLVLQNDMLTKVDRMSMANSLEVRVPFLDHKLVEFAFQLPEEFKLNHGMKKRILQDAFRDELPAEIYKRKKQGFEVPLLDCFKTEMRSMIMDDLLADSFVQDQGIFNLTSVKSLKEKLFSSNPGDSHATVWALVVFQSWWKKYLK